MDIAGLVRGAAAGEGLGNAFLANIKATDGIFHLVRAFQDQNIVHVENSVDAIRDVEIIDLELRLKDADQISGLTTKLSTKSTSRSKDTATLSTNVEFLNHIHSLLTTTTTGQGRALALEPWTTDEARALAQLRLLSLKPVVHLVNQSEQDYIACLNGGGEPPYMTRLREHAGEQGHVVGYSGAMEGLLADMETAEEREEVIEDLKKSFGVAVVRSAVPRIVWAGYEAVGLNHYFTFGKQEVRAWTVRKGTKGPQAAAVIHSDFEKAFVAAEVMRLEDLQAYGSEDAVRAAGKYVTRGKDAVIGDGDVVNFKIGKRKA
ncbi:hypothetical protein HK100_004520 [Physocladia obscura]|uniref:GTP-binding protein n=1 Tax=Physocladia obscura TaxID=109957 RepID=A0AAD5X9V6_9FUNG|nr:hypothetical protein HK100_004520 [Physocladia obscura]